jgi:hypothetical protein
MQVPVKISFPESKTSKEMAKIIVFFWVVLVVLGLFEDDFELVYLIPISILFIVLLGLIYKSSLCLADEVWDHGDYFKVVKGKTCRDIKLSEISNVETTFSNQKHLISLKLKGKRLFNNEVVFRATKGYLIFSPPPVLQEIKDRVKDA